jgi:acyl carrier protein
MEGMMSTTLTDSIIAEVLSSVLQKPVRPGEDLTRETEASWDSLKHIEIIFALEAAVGVSFTNEDITSIASVADIKKRVAAKNAP